MRRQRAKKTRTGLPAYMPPSIAVSIAVYAHADGCRRTGARHPAPHLLIDFLPRSDAHAQARTCCRYQQSHSPVDEDVGALLALFADKSDASCHQLRPPSLTTSSLRLTPSLTPPPPPTKQGAPDSISAPHSCAGWEGCVPSDTVMPSGCTHKLASAHTSVDARAGLCQPVSSPCTRTSAPFPRPLSPPPRHLHASPPSPPILVSP